MVHHEDKSGSDVPPDLPALRDDLKIFTGPPLDSGAPTWTLHDPARNRFFSIGRLEFELLSRWPLGTTENVIKGIHQETTLRVTGEQVKELLHFLTINSLLEPSSAAVLDQLKNKVMRPGKGIFYWLLHHYLFIRIPLIHPDRFLDATLPILRPFFSRVWLYLLGSATVLGLFLVGRQWESFINTFTYFFSFKGMVFYGLTIFGVKLFHELGHAYTAKYYGVKVPTMGVAFLVLWPVLYSDTSESWKLKSRTSRMAIVASGTGVDLALAGLATVMWNFLPDSPFRSACFLIATTTWISSLLLNLSPFMRFDGYYLLSDILNVPNLQDRAFAIGKWYLRKTLLGIRSECPEHFSPRKTSHLILYAYATWLYRLVLFTTIALAVYHLFFKVLGIFLFIVEMTWFVFRPVFGEIKTWWRHRSSVGLNFRVLTTLSVLGFLAYFFIAPWNTSIEAPAIVKVSAFTRIYPPFSSQIQGVYAKEGKAFKAGELLFLLKSPHLQLNERLAEKRVRVLEANLKRHLNNRDLIEQVKVIQQQLAEAMTELQGYRNQRKLLKVTAKMDGKIVDISDGIRSGLWVNKGQPLSGLASQEGIFIEGYVEEDSLQRIKQGHPARFYAGVKDIRPIDCILRQIDPTATRQLSEPYFASVYRAEIPADEKGDINRRVHNSIYRIILTPTDEFQIPDQVIHGNVVIKGKRRSWFKYSWQCIRAVLVRESGF